MSNPVAADGLAFVRNILLGKKGSRPNQGQKKTAPAQSSKPKTLHMPSPRPKKSITPQSNTQQKTKRTPATNPIQNLMNGLSSSLSKISQQQPREDYEAVVKSFLPENARLLVPQSPASAARIQLADVDGDSQNELITSYAHNDNINTLILKKQDGKWSRFAHVGAPNYEGIDYRGFADVTNRGKKQLLIGYNTKENTKELHGYSLENGTANSLFTHRYNRMEVLDSPQNNGTPSNAQLAIWNTSNIDADTHNIEVKNWNGSNFEASNTVSPYYFNRALPYYVRKVKQAPHKPSNWYHLADALDKVGSYREGLSAIDYGMGRNPESQLKEEFLTLKRKIEEKMKK